MNTVVALSRQCVFSYEPSVNISDRKILYIVSNYIAALLCELACETEVHSPEQKILNKDHINAVSLQHVMPHVVGDSELWRIF